MPQTATDFSPSALKKYVYTTAQCVKVTSLQRLNLTSAYLINTPN